MRNAIRLSLLGLIGGVSVLTADVTSAHTGGLPIGSCNTQGSGTPYYSWDGILNSSTTNSLTVECSLSGTFPTPTFPNQIDHHFINTVDLNAVDVTVSGSVSCQMKVLDTFGNVNFTGSTQNSATQDPAPIGWTANAAGFAYISCAVPAATGGGVGNRSGIRGIYILN